MLILESVRLAFLSLKPQSEQFGISHFDPSSMKIPMFAWILIFLPFSSAVNIVVFLPGTTDDDRRLLNRLSQQLAFRNHHVCAFRAVIVPEKKYLVQPRLHDVRELKLKTNLSSDFYEAVRRRGNNQEIWNALYDYSDQLAMPLWLAYANACESIIDSDLMDRLRDELYDVAVVYAGNPCHLGIVHALAMPFIYFDMDGFSDELVMASSSPWLPSLPLSSRSISDDQFSLIQKTNQFLQYIREYSVFINQPLLTQWISDRWSILDEPISRLFRENRELKKRFPDFPHVNEIKKLASAYFVNSDQVLELHGRPTVPNLVYVGGTHIEYPRPLFPPFNETNALAKDGVIIFSMGHMVNATGMPTWMKRAFLKAFGRFPRTRIYWRISSSILDHEISPDEIPKNINISQYIPQNDLMAAEETVLLITHGGANSIMEAVNYGIPVLGIPLYGVHHSNLKKLESKGSALILQKHQINAQSVYEAMMKLLRDEKYFISAQRLSRMYKDRQLNPLETAVHWVEYIGRHHGARYKSIRSISKLRFYEYLMLDFALMITVCLYASVISIRLIWRLWKFVIFTIFSKSGRRKIEDRSIDSGSTSRNGNRPKSE